MGCCLFPLKPRTTILHLFIIGWEESFFYLFCRQLLISRFGGAVASLIYLFGSSQGGYFYNMNSQKTCIWFPLVLLLMEKYIQKRNWIYLLGIGLIFGIQINAGYLQIAFYCLIFSYFYYFLRVIFFKTDGGSLPRRFLFFLFSASLMGGIGLLLGLPQILATFELSQFSSRLNLPESFAYIGSFSPQAFLTLLLPFLDSHLGSDFYVGLFGIFLVLVAWFGRKEWPSSIWVIFWMSLFALLIALGKFSPLYVLIVKVTHFYGFRVPAKALFFAVFGLAVLAGAGID